MTKQASQSDEPIRVPFTILIDSNETQPFAFEGLRADSAQQNRPLEVSTCWCCLGRWPNSIGDYSILGYTDRIGVERKSIEDVWATVMGHATVYERVNGLPGRRQRFEDELANLQQLESAAVIVEASLGDCLANVPAFGKRPIDVVRKSFHRSIIAFQQDYRVPWLFCGSRELAEVTAFRWLERFWKKQREAEKLRQKELRNARPIFDRLDAAGSVSATAAAGSG